MARRPTSREIVLAAFLLVIAVGYLWYRSGSSTARDVLLAADENAKKEAQPPPAPVVRTDLLAMRAAGYETHGRDLFQYAARPPSVEEVQRMKEEAARRKREAEEAAKRAAEEAARRQKEQEEIAKEMAIHPPPPPPPTPPAISFRYLGYLGPKEAKIAVFENGNEMLLARKGEVVAKEFKVVDIKYDTIVMGFVRPEFEGQTRELAMMRK